MTIPEAVGLVLRTTALGKGGEIFVPRIPSMKITDLATAIGPDCKQEVVGIRPGEKMDEIMVSDEEAPRTIKRGDYYAILPMLPELIPGNAARLILAFLALFIGVKLLAALLGMAMHVVNAAARELDN